MSAILVKVLADVQVFDDPSTEKVKLFGSLSTYSEREFSTMYKVNSGKLDIAASGNLDLPLGDVTDPRGYCILADSDFNLTFNGGTDVLAIKRAASTTGSRCISLQEADFTEINIANPSSSAALTAIFVVWGDLS